jgi:uncharacterized protein (DUF2141 family)
MKKVKVQASMLVGAALLLSMALMRSLPHAQTSNAFTLTVHVTNAINAKGMIRAALFPSADGFPGDTSKAMRTQGAQIDPKTLTSEIVFASIPPGIYAVSVFDDENRNGKLDKNFVGMPKEGYGASNNPKKKMGPPAFDEARFSLKGDQSIEIVLIH